jgi:hypothetical protein
VSSSGVGQFGLVPGKRRSPRLARWIYSYTFDLGAIHAGAVVTSLAFVVSELIVLSLIVALVSFWIAAGWDARQGTIALNEDRRYEPIWWFVKVKQFLIDDPEEAEEESR